MGTSMQKGALHVPGDQDDHWSRKAAKVLGPGVEAESVRQERAEQSCLQGS